MSSPVREVGVDQLDQVLRGGGGHSRGQDRRLPPLILLVLLPMLPNLILALPDRVGGDDVAEVVRGGDGGSHDDVGHLPGREEDVVALPVAHGHQQLRQRHPGRVGRPPPPGLGHPHPGGAGARGQSRGGQEGPLVDAHGRGKTGARGGEHLRSMYRTGMVRSAISPTGFLGQLTNLARVPNTTFSLKCITVSPNLHVFGAEWDPDS